MVFKNGVKNIQAAAYNGARTVDSVICIQEDSSREVVFQCLMLCEFKVVISRPCSYYKIDFV